MTARPAVTSPAATPCGDRRVGCDWMIARRERALRADAPRASFSPRSRAASSQKAAAVKFSRSLESRGHSAELARGRHAVQASPPWRRRARSLRPSPRRRARRSWPAMASPSQRPVASANTVSPSPVVCDGLIARAKPSSAISATRLTSVLVSRRVGGDQADRRVLAGARRGAAAERRRIRSSLRTSASDLPSSVRTPATTCPVCGSMMSPTALTATIAATTRPFGSVIAAEPSAALHRAAQPILPTVAPAPAPTLPSATGPVVAAVCAPCSRSPRSAGSSACRRSRRSNRIAAGTIGTTPAPHLPADVAFLEVAHDALRARRGRRRCRPRARSR